MVVPVLYVKRLRIKTMATCTGNKIFPAKDFVRWGIFSAFVVLSAHLRRVGIDEVRYEQAEEFTPHDGSAGRVDLKDGFYLKHVTPASTLSMQWRATRGKCHILDELNHGRRN